MFSRACVLLAIGLLGLTGCGPGRVSGDISKTLSASQPEAIYTVPSASAERTISVEVTSTVSEIDIYVITGDTDKFLGENHDNRAKKALKAVQVVKNGSLEATIPANTEATVIVYLSDKAKPRSETQVTGKFSSK